MSLSIFYKTNTKWFSLQDTVIQTLGMLLDFLKAKKHLPSGSAFRTSHNIPCVWITLSCTENHFIFL